MININNIFYIYTTLGTVVMFKDKKIQVIGHFDI